MASPELVSRAAPRDPVPPSAASEAPEEEIEEEEEARRRRFGLMAGTITAEQFGPGFDAALTELASEMVVKNLRSNVRGAGQRLLRLSIAA